MLRTELDFSTSGCVVQRDVARPGKSGTVAVSVRNLRKIFRKRKTGTPFFRSLFKPEYVEVRAIDGVSFHVRKGEIYGVLGANGSGKSCLIRALSTLLIPDCGEVEIFGLDVRKSSSKVRRLLNRVSVDAAFYKCLSPRENLLYSARLYGVDPAEAEARSLAILDRLGIRRDSFREPLEQMSRGMQQKVAIARAFLASPVLVLLDEPTTGLDPKSRLEVQEFILELRTSHDATIIITTHDMREAEKLCDRVAFIQNGRIAAEGSSAEVKGCAGSDATLEDAFMKFSGAPVQ